MSQELHKFLRSFRLESKITSNTLNKFKKFMLKNKIAGKKHKRQRKIKNKIKNHHKMWIQFPFRFNGEENKNWLSFVPLFGSNVFKCRMAPSLYLRVRFIFVESTVHFMVQYRLYGMKIMQTHCWNIHSGALGCSFSLCLFHYYGMLDGMFFFALIKTMNAHRHRA